MKSSSFFGQHASDHPHTASLSHPSFEQLNCKAAQDGLHAALHQELCCLVGWGQPPALHQPEHGVEQQDGVHVAGRREGGVGEEVRGLVGERGVAEDGPVPDHRGAGEDVDGEGQGPEAE
eukprot:10217070-Prorocentrum_lima.AAC.1